MNSTRIWPQPDHKEVLYNAVDHIKAIIKRIENGSLNTGDNMGADDLKVMAYIGYPSGIVTDGAQLLRLLNDKLVHLNNNERGLQHEQ